MNILFEYDGKKLVLPVNPESVIVNKPSQSQKVEVLGLGEVSVPQKRKLATISIKSFFWYDLFTQSILLSNVGSLASALPPFLTNQLQSQVSRGVSTVTSKLPSKITSFIGGVVDDAQKFKLLNEYVQWFEDWQASKKPARWTIVVPPNEPPQCYDFNVTCENFRYEIKAGEENDYYYEIELLEWRDYGAKILNEQKQSDGSTKFEQQGETRLDTKETPKPSKLATAKDTIWSVSKQYCKDNWKDLYNYGVNKTFLSSSPQNIAGTTLQIPNIYRT